MKDNGLRKALLLVGFALFFAPAMAQTDSHVVTVEVEANKMWQNVRSGGDGSDYTQMTDNRRPDKPGRGPALKEFESVVAPGGKLTWEFKIIGPEKVVQIVDFSFDPQVGENFFMQEGGILPRAMPDGTYQGQVSPQAKPGDRLKYSVVVLIDGKQFIVDPVVVVGEGGGQ